jgi:hypothetical protein
VVLLPNSDCFEAGTLIATSYASWKWFQVLESAMQAYTLIYVVLTGSLALGLSFSPLAP